MNMSRISLQKGNAFVFAAALLGVVGSIVLGGLSSIKAEKTGLSVREQKKIADKAKKLLLSYSISYGRMPCPAESKGEQENCSSGLQKGWLPLETLIKAMGALSTSEKNLLANTRYVVYRNSSQGQIDLSTLSNDSAPYVSKSVDSTVVSSVVGLNDLCAKLDKMNTTQIGGLNSSAYVISTSGVNNVPAAVAVGNDDNFSDLNSSESPGLENPQRPVDTVYKDVVSVLTKEIIQDTLQCTAVLQSIDTLTLGAKWIQKAQDRRVADIKKWADLIETEQRLIFWNAWERVAGWLNEAFKKDGKLVKTAAGIIDGIVKCLGGKADSCAGIPKDLAYLYTTKDAKLETVLKQIFSDLNKFAAPVVRQTYYFYVKALTETTVIWDGRADLIGSAERLGPYNPIRQSTSTGSGTGNKDEFLDLTVSK
jgi:hypothetical protein